MKKKIKKAFTLVELLVVIAILAILATVSIVGYNSFTKKAKVSNDTVLVKQMNDILFANSQTDDANPTMSKALEDVLDGGYDLDKLTPTTTGYNIVWDSKNDQMVLLDENMDAVYPSDVDMTKKYNYFAMVSSEDEITTGNKVGFSHYLKDGFTSNGVIETSTGIDVGNNTNINTINYSNPTDKQSNDENYSIVIKTNSFDTSLKINAEYDTIKHYGNVKEVNIAKVAQSSYHEFGTVSGNINLAYGRVALEDNSSVSNVVVKAIDDVTPTSDTVKVSVASKAEANLVISEVNNVTVSVDGTGANNITKLDNVSGKAAAIGSTTYDTYDDAFIAAKSNDTITLLNDCNSTIYSYTKNITIDLNGNTLSFNFIKVNNSKNLTLNNGLIKSTTGSNGVGIQVMSNAGLRLSCVDYSGPTYGIYPAGDASYVDIYNSTIKAIAGIAANANGTSSNNIKVTIDSSTIDASGEGAQIGLWINVPGIMTIRNSTIKGNKQALMVRCGNANITNSNVILTGTGENLDADFIDRKVWGTGNDVPEGALIVGNWTDGSGYRNNASCTLTNTNISTTRTNVSRPLVILAQRESFETILNYDSTCNFTNGDYLVWNDSESGIKKGQISVNGTVVQEREK